MLGTRKQYYKGQWNPTIKRLFSLWKGKTLSDGNDLLNDT